MTVDLAYLTDIASEFASADSARVDRLVVIATLETPASLWGASQDIGVAYLVAHMLKIDQLRGKGAQTAQSIGDVSESFAQVAPTSTNPSSLELTAYGREYLRRRRMLAATRGPIVT